MRVALSRRFLFLLEIKLLARVYRLGDRLGTLSRKERESFSLATKLGVSFALVGDAYVVEAASERCGAHIDNTRCELLYQVSVVRHRYERALVVLKCLLKRLARANVKVVGGLVEHEKVCFFKNELRERQPCAFSAAKLGYLLIYVLSDKAEERESASYLGLGHLSVGVPELVKHGARGLKILVLLIVVADADVVSRLYISRADRKLPKKKLDEGGFSTAVGAYEEETVAPAHREAHIREKCRAARI